jgi:hypothetical protein
MRTAKERKKYSRQIDRWELNQAAEPREKSSGNNTCAENSENGREKQEPKKEQSRSLTAQTKNGVMLPELTNWNETLRRELRLPAESSSNRSYLIPK